MTIQVLRAGVAVFVLTGLVAHGSGCSSDASSTTPSASDVPAGAVPGPFDPAQPIAWAPCATAPGAECAELRVPLEWTDPNGPQITVMTVRSLSATPTAAIFWEVAGGPGGRSVSTNFASYGRSLETALGAPLDYYGYEHRGVGLSTRLACSTLEATLKKSLAEMDEPETRRCGEELTARWGSRLRGFTALNAAHDLAYLTKRMRAPEKRLFVRGISYGTNLTLRYLNLSPAEPTGVILDSISPPSSYYSTYDEGFLEVGRALAEYCKKDAFCTSKMGADPWATITSAIGALRGSGCPALFAGQPETTASGDRVREQAVHNISGILGQGNTVGPQVLGDFLAVMYRVNRCNAQDVAAITRRLTAIEDPAVVPPDEPGGTQPDNARGESDDEALYDNVVFDGIWGEPPPSIESLTAACLAGPICIGGNVHSAKRRAVWPLFPVSDDTLRDKWPPFTVPVLAMNGDLDAQTSISDALPTKDRLTGPTQAFVRFPYGTHALSAGAGASAVTAENEADCGLQLLAQFVADPTKPVNSACLSDTKPVDFRGSAAQAKTFGSPDIWEN